MVIVTVHIQAGNYLFSVKMNDVKSTNADIECLLLVVLLHVVQRVLNRRRQRLQRKRGVRRRLCWVKPWLLRRHHLGAYDGLMVELANEDIPGYVAFQRMAPDLFGELLAKVGPLIQKQDTIMRQSISPGARLAITLRYLATGRCIYV
jgi:hypothetical protein